MLKIERVLCPVDFSEFSEKAYDYAFLLAHYYEAKLFLEHVISPIGATYPYYVLPDAAVATIYWDLSSFKSGHDPC